MTKNMLSLERKDLCFCCCFKKKKIVIVCIFIFLQCTTFPSRENTSAILINK